MDPETHEPYNENKLAHQESPLAISEWQRWNDPTGALSTSFEHDLEKEETPST